MSIREESIKQKLQKAKTLLAETDVLMEHKFYNTVINRLYYACFYATKALLLTKDLTLKTHSGVATALNQHFVLTNSFNKTHSAFFNKLMQERMDDDYSDFIVSDEKDVRIFIQPSKEYVTYVETLIDAL